MENHLLFTLTDVFPTYTQTSLQTLPEHLLIESLGVWTVNHRFRLPSVYCTHDPFSPSDTRQEPGSPSGYVWPSVSLFDHEEKPNRTLLIPQSHSYCNSQLLVFRDRSFSHILSLCHMKIQGLNTINTSIFFIYSFSLFSFSFDSEHTLFVDSCVSLVDHLHLYLHF